MFYLFCDNPLACCGLQPASARVGGERAALSYGVAQRMQETGVRMAPGAQRGDIARPVLSRGLILTITGLVLGLAGAVVLSRAVAMAAALGPARRASRVDPVVVLRYE